MKVCDDAAPQFFDCVQLDPNVVPAWYLGFISGVARGAAVAIFNPISIVKTRMESSLVGLRSATTVAALRGEALRCFEGLQECFWR